jgi:DNA-binding transcriptional regulator YiaG
MDRQFAKRALEIAEKELGSSELARRLKAPEPSVRAWRSGHLGLPPQKYRLLVKIVKELALKDIVGP